ncbi:MAG: hypothetical protein V4482_06265 [Pseudomonadota bacterium]
MIVWQNLKINSTPSIITLLQGLCNRLATSVNHVQFIVRELLTNKTPEFVKVHIQPTKIMLFHIKNRHIIDRSEILVHDLNTALLNPFLSSRSTLPLQILIDDENVSYRLISLRQIKWWNRHGLFNQIRVAEFDATDWIYNESVPSADDAHRHVFIGFKPSFIVSEAFMYLNKLQNPIAKIQLSSVQQTAAAMDRIKEHEPTRSFCPWSLFIRKLSETEWLLSAQQYGAIVLSRRGTFAANSTEETTIENEIATTLRYLQRNGYEEGEKLTLITAGFSDKFNANTFEEVNITDVISVPVRDIDTRIQLGSHFNELSSHGFWILNQLRSVFNKPQPFYSKGFNPRAMLSQRLAYWAPFICYRFIIPLIICCMATFITYASKNQTLKNDIKLTLFKKNAMFATTGDEKRREAASNFDVFKDLVCEDPLPFLKTLSVALAKEAQITQFSWHTSKKGNHWHPAFEATVSMTDSSFSAKRKNRNNKTINTFHHRIQKKLQHNHPNITVVWLPIPGKKAYTLGVSWD